MSSVKYDNKVSGPTMFTDSVELGLNRPPWKLIYDSIMAD